MAMPDDPRQSLGKLGEDLACAELERRGYAILARRYRTRFGEIDIVARDGETIVFVEVKARLTATTLAAAAAAVTGVEAAADRGDGRRLSVAATGCTSVRAASTWWPSMFDRGRPRVEVYANAFDATVVTPCRL